MKRFDFIACSLAFHASLFVIVLLLPAPFPSSHEKGGGYAFVELSPVVEKSAIAPFPFHSPPHLRGGGRGGGYLN